MSVPAPVTHCRLTLDIHSQLLERRRHPRARARLYLMSPHRRLLKLLISEKVSSHTSPIEPRVLGLFLLSRVGELILIARPRLQQKLETFIRLVHTQLQAL